MIYFTGEMGDIVSDEELSKMSKEELIQLVKRMEKLINEKDLASRIDHMTGLLNRRGFKIKINEHGEVSYSVIMADIDNFKSVNDRYGHPVGDLSISLISDIIKSLIREEDAYVCRFGGDEIMILLIGCEPEAAVEKCEEIKQTVLKESINKLGFPITMSFGIAQRNPETQYETIKKLADEALYYSKFTGKNKVTLYNEKVSTFVSTYMGSGGIDGTKGIGTK